MDKLQARAVIPILRKFTVARLLEPWPLLTQDLSNFMDFHWHIGLFLQLLVTFLSRESLEWAVVCLNSLFNFRNSSDKVQHFHQASLQGLGQGAILSEKRTKGRLEIPGIDLNPPGLEFNAPRGSILCRCYGYCWHQEIEVARGSLFSPWRMPPLNLFR